MGREVSDGGPAFPRFEQERIYRDAHDRSGELQYVPQDGMSLRDYFAAHAPQPSERVMGGPIDEEQRDAILRACAENAYRWADAMLKARSA